MVETMQEKSRKSWIGRRKFALQDETWWLVVGGILVSTEKMLFYEKTKQNPSALASSRDRESGNCHIEQCESTPVNIVRDVPELGE